MYPQPEKGYSPGAALNAYPSSPAPAPEGISSVLPRVQNRSLELAGMIRSFRQSVMPTPEKDSSLREPSRNGLLGQLQEIDETLAQAVRDMDWLCNHFNS